MDDDILKIINKMTDVAVQEMLMAVVDLKGVHAWFAKQRIDAAKTRISSELYKIFIKEIAAENKRVRELADLNTHWRS